MDSNHTQSVVLIRKAQERGTERGLSLTTVSDTAIGLTAAKAAVAKAVFITIETDAIRYRVDGTDPTATEGHSVAAAQNLYFAAPNVGGLILTQLKMIRVTTDATARVTYYG